MGRYNGYLQPTKMLHNERDMALVRNSCVRNLYVSYLHEIAMARFKWHGLPKEIDERFLEMSLNEFGMVAFFRDEVVGLYVALPAMIDGSFNIYMNPNAMRAWATNGYQRSLSYENSVPIWNSMIREPTWPWLDYYANQLYEIDTTRSINVRAQKTPIMIRGTDKQRLTLKNLYLEYSGNEPVLLVDESLGASPIEVLKTSADYRGEELTQLRRHILGEIMNRLGYENQDAVSKRERLVSGEINASKSEAYINRYSPLIVRRQAAEQINEMFGLDVEVNFRQDSETIVEMTDALSQLKLDMSKREGDLIDGEVHNGTPVTD